MLPRSGVLAGAGIGVLFACAGAGCARLPPVPPPVQLAAGAAPSLPPGPPLLRPGERMLWQVRVGPFAGGTVRVSAAAPRWMNRRPVAVVRGQFAAGGIAALFDDSASDDTTWIDLATARPIHYRSELAGDGERSTVVARFGDRGVELVERGRNGRPRHAHQEVPSDPPLNLYAALFALRGWPDRARGEATLSVWARSRLWRATVRRGGTVFVSSTMRGRMRAVRIDGIAWRTRRDGSPDPDTRPRRFRVYLGADRDRLPVLIETDTRYGVVSAELVDYRAPERSDRASLP